MTLSESYKNWKKIGKTSIFRVYFSFSKSMRIPWQNIRLSETIWKSFKKYQTLTLNDKFLILLRVLSLFWMRISLKWRNRSLNWRENMQDSTGSNPVSWNLNLNRNLRKWKKKQIDWVRNYNWAKLSIEKNKKNLIKKLPT